MHALPLFHMLTGQPVILLGAGPAAEAKRRLIERAGGVPVGEDDPVARLAFVAIDDAGEAVAAAKRLKARGLLVNVADRPALCDFTVPSLVDREPVVIAVGTGGVSAGLAKALRLRLDALLPAGLGALAQALNAARAGLRARWPEAAARRKALDIALTAGGPLDPLGELAPDAVAQWLANASSPGSGSIVEIRLASNDPDDLTLRTARLLGMADMVVHDLSISEAILGRARADARRVVGEAPSTPGQDLVIVLRGAG